MYNEIDMTEPTTDIGTKSILAFKNTTVDHINALCLDMLRTQEQATELVAADSNFEWVSHDNSDPSELSLKGTGVPP